MAINPNNGVLDIINGTLRVSSIDIKQAGGFTTAINTVARNDVLLYDDQDANTTFTPTRNVGYSSSSGVTRDTTAIDFNDGWVYWPLQLPNSWHTEFDILIPTTGGVLTYSLFNTSEPNHTDYTANDGGYKIVFDNTQNQIDVRWEGSVHATTSANVRSADWQHVNINYFQGAVSISLAGKVVLTHKFTENYQEFDSRYVGFSATSGASHKIRHLIVHNSDKWLYTKTSNASDISYVSGNVGIGSLSPTELLDVHGNVHIAKDLTVDGNLTVSGTTTFIDTQNLAIEDPIIEVARGNASDTIDAGLVITRASSNVAVAYRGDEEELALGYTQSGASDTDVTPIADGGLSVRVYGNLFANNLTTTANVEATYLKGNGSEITHVTLDQVVDYGNTTANTIHLTNTDVGLKADGNVEANYFIGNGSQLDGISSTLQEITDNGNVTTNTIQFTNTTTALVADSNVGIGTDAPSANLHVVGHQYVNDPPTLANSFDHSDAPLTLTHGTPTSTTAIDDPKPVLHLTRDGTSGQAYGARASFNLSRYENSGTASRSRLDVALTDGTYAESNVMSIRADGKVGIGTTAPGYTLDVNGDINLSGDFYQGGSPFVSSLWTDGSESLYYRSNVEVGTANLFVDTTTSRVGINTITPEYDLDVDGDINFTGNFYQGGSPFVSSEWTTGSESLYYRSNVEVGTANLFVDTTTSRVGINTITPGYDLDVHGTSNVGALTATSISGPLSGNASTATALETARTINGVSFDGTGNITITANTPNTLSRGSYLTGSNFNGSAATTWAVDATTTNTASKIVARDSNGDIFGRYLHGSYVNISHGTATRSTDTIFYSSTDNYIRKTNATGMRASLNVPTRTGGDASGTWGISITGNASTATSVSGGTAVIGTNPSHDDSFDYSDIPLQAHYNSTVTSNTTLNDPKSVMMLTREGTTSEAYGAGAAFQLSRWENNGTNSRSRLDIALTDGTFDLTSIMTMRSNGNVGIGVTSPAYKLDVSGTLHAGNSYFDNVYIGGSTSRGLRAVSGNYGTVQTTGGGAGNWEGYSIDGRYVFMSENNNSCGIYNDLDNEWMVYCYRNTWVRLYYNGATKLETNNGGVTVTGTVTATTFSGNQSGGSVSATTGTFSGNVGIGTTSPSGKLHLYYSGTAANMIDKRTNISTNDYGQTLNYTHYSSVAQGASRNPDNSRGLWIGNMVDENDGSPSGANFAAFTNSFQFYAVADQEKYADGLSFTSNTDTLKHSGGNFVKVMRINADGNVGVGTTSPSYKLDVHGTANVGTLTTTSVSGNGSGLTSLNASNISSGTLGTARIPNLDAGKITTGTLTRPISTTTGTFSGVVTMRGQQDNADGSDRASYWNYDDKVALVLEPAADDGAVAILFPSQGNKSSDFAYIVYDEDYGEAGVTAGENGALILGCENDGAGSSDHVRIKSRLVVEADHSSSDPTNAFQVKSSNTTSDLFTVTRSGNVGIGTTDPAYKLDVHGTSNVGALTATSVSGNGSGLTSLNASNLASGTVPSARLSLAASDIPDLSASKITSGTLTRPIDTTFITLNVGTRGDVYFEDNSNDNANGAGFTLRTSSNPTTGSIFAVRSSGQAGRLWVGQDLTSTGVNPFYAGYSGTNGGESNSSSYNFVVTTSGDVGIGTTSPGYTLDVHGTSNVGALTTTSVSGNGSGLTSVNASNLASGTVSSYRLSLAASDIPDLSASKITSGTLGRPISTSTGVFTSTGNVVLVGPNGGGQVGLTINDGDGNANITFNHASRVPDQNGSSGRIDCGVDGTTGYMRLRVKSSVTGGTSTGNLPECVRIEEGYVRAYSNFYVDDNVGIGTTNPGARLEVLGNSANQWGNILYLKNSAGSNRLSLKDEQTSPYIPPGLWTGAGGGLSIGSQYEGIMFYASASGATPVERMRITSGGNVGIGTNAPMKSLDVRNGDGEAAANWISGVFGSKTGLSSNPRVVVGTYSNVAIVGSHTGSLNAWNDLYLNNPSYPCVVKANGSVGIGTTSPIYKLDVRGDVYVDNSSVFMSGYTEGPTNNTVYSQYIGKRYSGRILAGMEIENVRTNSAGTAITTTGHYGQKLHFRAHDYGIYGGNVGDRTMTIVGSNVGIGTTSPSYKLHVSGDIYATGNVIAYSDVRKKKNLEIIEKPVEKVNKLNGYTYEMDDKRYTGLVAQEVLKVLPEAVVGDEENGYGLAYGNMVGLLVEALKEVNEQLQAEKAKVATVLARLDALENA